MLEVVVQDGVKRTVCTQAVGRNHAIYALHPTSHVDRPTRTSIQVGPELHIEDDIIACINHSCRPTVVVYVWSMTLVTLAPLTVGDEVTFFYPALDWEMASPFACRCGQPECIGVVAGARHLQLSVLLRYRLATHIVDMACGSLRQACVGGV